jgi:hypothetical protein
MAEPIRKEDIRNARDVEAGDSAMDIPRTGSSESGNAQPGKETEEEVRKPSRVRELWAKTGLDKHTLKMMFKLVLVRSLRLRHKTDMRRGSLPPTITMAWYLFLFSFLSLFIKE